MALFDIGAGRPTARRPALLVLFHIGGGKNPVTADPPTIQKTGAGQLPHPAIVYPQDGGDFFTSH